MDKDGENIGEGAISSTDVAGPINVTQGPAEAERI